MQLHCGFMIVFLWIVLAAGLSAIINPVAALGGVSIFLLGYIWGLKQKERLSAADVIFAGGFLMNLWYVLFSFGDMRQYDYYNFYMQADYFEKHNFFVFEPHAYLRNVFYQPPLWGGICGIVTKIMMLCGKESLEGFGFVRFLSLFAISGAGIIFGKFCTKLKWSEDVSLLMFFMFCFMPIHGILGNLVNNDAAVYFLMLTALYVAFNWYEKGRWRDVLILGAILICAGMVKFSGLMVVPAILLLGVLKFFGDRKGRGQILGQTAVVGGCAIIGFLWGLFLLFHHLSLVPPPQNAEYQSMQMYSLAERLFSVKGMSMPFVDVKNGVFEVNVWLTLIKTSLFGEWAWNGVFWAYLLYGIGILWGIGAVISLKGLFGYKIGRDFAFNAALVVLMFTVIIGWANFWLEYPYFCSSEFRYVVILLPVALIWGGNYLFCQKKSKALMKGLWIMAIVAVAARFMLYLNTI